MGLKKSFAPLTIAIIGGILMFAFFLLPFIMFLSFRYHIVAQVTLTYEYNSADVVLLEFLEYKQNYRLLAERNLPSFEEYTMSKNALTSMLNTGLRLLTMSDCYSLKSGTSTIVQSGNCERRDVTWAEIFLPYNPGRLTEKISLEVSK